MTAERGGVEVVRVAERALLVRYDGDDLATAVARAHALERELEREAGARAAEGHAAPHPDRDLLLKGERVCGAGNLLVVLSRMIGADRMERVVADLRERAESVPFNGALRAMNEHRFRVRYGGEEGPDLAALAAETGLAPERVVELHASAEYTVACVGFAPGFGYLIGLPPELEVDRLASPRSRLPAGSVAVAGPFTGVYPSPTPGGWRVIGRRTDEAPVLFDPARERPALLAPGDRVRFVAEPPAP